MSTPTRVPAPSPTPRTRPVWPAYAIAALALFCGLGGPAYAATLITGADIRDGSVASADLKDDSVKGVDVRNGSLSSNDLSEQARTNLSSTAGACSPGHELRWLTVGLVAGGLDIDESIRIGRCVATGTATMGDGATQAGEQCDDANSASGDGCSATGILEGVVALDLFPDGPAAR